jgi:hypothetical protein
MRRMRALALSAVILGCSRGGPPGPAPAAEPAASAPTAAAGPSQGTLAIGEPITRPLVPLAALAANPALYRERVVATAGKVTAVCQEMGCWMDLADETGTAHVRMHGHAFFVPKSASGHRARVQATVVAPGHGPDREEEEAAGKEANVELDATGVELD